jgi:hypothetical protein
MPDESTNQGTPTQDDPQKIIGELKTKLDSTMATLTNVQRADKQKQDYIIAMTSKLEELAAKATTEKGKKTNEELVDETLEAFKDNPHAVMDAHFNARMRPILAEHLENQGSLQKEATVRRLQDKYGSKEGVKKWEKYQDQVEEMMERMGPSAKARPWAWDEAYNYIVARNVDQEVEDRIKEKIKKEEESMVEATTAASSRGGASAALTENEKRVAKGLGMSEDDYKKGKAASIPWDQMR